MSKIFGFNSETEKIKKLINQGAANKMTNTQFLEMEIDSWKKSANRKAMINGENYYNGEHDIKKRKRTAIGEGGALQEVDNLPNNRIVDNQYAKMVDQKINYLLSKPLTLDIENKEYDKLLKQVMNKRFLRTLKNLGQDSINAGIGWLHPYYNESGELMFKRFPPYEILPFWKDSEHTILEFAIRLYQIQVYEGRQEKTIEKVEVYSTKGVDRYILLKGSLVKDIENPSSNHMIIVDKDNKATGYNWSKVPIIPFKYNSNETPLISRVKSLQDGINKTLSNFQNNMEEDARNTILVLVNYDGEKLGEFRHNLATYGAIKVKSTEGSKGDVRTLQVEVNPENYKIILELFKKALIENARGFDAKDDRLSGTPNQMNIQSMYSDIDLDANGMESEYQAAFEELLWFIDMNLNNTGKGDYTNELVDIVFNRDILINESETIENCSKSVGVLSEETILTNHPWVTDVKSELDRVKEQEPIDGYKDAFNKGLSNEE